MQVTFIALGVLAILTILSLLIREKSEFLKWILFSSITLTVIFNSSYLVWSTLLINQESKTKGPVHWHGDFEIWNCGQKVDIIDPKGLENKVGTPIFHEHGDNRIHVEGPVLDYQEISLRQFFKVVGGSMSNQILVVPTNNGQVAMEKGLGCNGELQVFVFKTEGNTFHQQKLDDSTSYVLSPYSKVPPGDCIIIEFDKVKKKTDKLCNLYQIAKDKGEISER